MFVGANVIVIGVMSTFFLPVQTAALVILDLLLNEIVSPPPPFSLPLREQRPSVFRLSSQLSRTASILSVQLLSCRENGITANLLFTYACSYFL